MIENITHKKFITLINVAIVSGIIGGAVSSWYLLKKYIEPQYRTAQIVRAQKFEGINQYGKILGTFESGSNGPSLNLFDHTGKVRASLRFYSIDLLRGHSSLDLYGYDEKQKIKLGVVQDELPTLTFYDKNGNILWEKQISE